MLSTKFQGHQPFVSGQEVSIKRVSHHLNVTLNDLEVWESYFHVVSTTVDNVYKKKKRNIYSYISILEQIDIAIL